MTNEQMNVRSRVFQGAVTAAGFVTLAAAIVYICTSYGLREMLIFLALIPLVIVLSLSPNNFPLPAGLKFTTEKTTYTLTDALVLLVACWYGPAPAIFVAGLEGYAASRRKSKRVSTVLFSCGMMSLTGAAAAFTLDLLLRRVFAGGEFLRQHELLVVALSILAANIAQIAVNMGLLSTLIALRHQTPVLQTMKKHLVWTAPMLLPTSAAASMMYFALHYRAFTMLVIALPVLLAIYLGQRQVRISVRERIEAMEKSHRETIEALAVAINAKDEVTHEHVLRVQIYAAGVARLLGCTSAEIEALRAGALLHDIGKIAVPDHILYKPSRLTAAEFDVMKIHTVVGAQILSRVEFPYPVVPIVRHHHERWDGRGYPDGLKAEEIPLTARILSVVDCFDAVREDRQYRKGLTREEAIDLIMSGSGSQYDPRVVGTFITNLPAFEAEIRAMRHKPVPTFGIEPAEKLPPAALSVAPAAGLLDEPEVSALAREVDFSRDELKALYQISQALGEAHNEKEIAEAFTQSLGALIPFETCAVTLITPKTGEVIIVHAAGLHRELLVGRRVPLDTGVTGWVIANRKLLANTNPKLDLPREHAAEFSAYRTLLVSPILKDEKIHGAVSLYAASFPEYTVEQQKLLTEGVSLLAAALASRAGARTERERTWPPYAPKGTVTDLSGFREAALHPDESTLKSDLEH